MFSLETSFGKDPWVPLFFHLHPRCSVNWCDSKIVPRSRTPWNLPSWNVAWKMRGNQRFWMSSLEKQIGTCNVRMFICETKQQHDLCVFCIVLQSASTSTLPAHQLSGFCVGLREAKRAINRKKCKVCWVPLGRNSWDFDDQPRSYIFGNLGNELRHRFFNHPPSRIDNRLKCCEFTRPLKLKPTEAWTSLIIMNQ